MKCPPPPSKRRSKSKLKLSSRKKRPLIGQDSTRKNANSAIRKPNIEKYGPITKLRMRITCSGSRLSNKSGNVEPNLAAFEEEFDTIRLFPISIFLKRFDADENENRNRRSRDDLMELVESRVVRIPVARVDGSSSTLLAGLKQLGNRNYMRKTGRMTNKPNGNGTKAAEQKKQSNVLSNGTAKKKAKQSYNRTSAKPLATNGNGARKNVSKQNPKIGTMSRNFNTSLSSSRPFPKTLKIKLRKPLKMPRNITSPSALGQVLPKRYTGCIKPFRIILQQLEITDSSDAEEAIQPIAVRPAPPPKVKVHNPPPRPRADPFKCDFCTREFPTKASLARHNMFHNFSCQVCSEKFNFESALQTHLLIHSEEMKYKCIQCGGRFKHIINFNAHTLSRRCSAAGSAEK